MPHTRCRTTLLAVRAIELDERLGGRILLRERSVVVERRRNLLGKLLAELDAPLVVRVDAPDRALDVSVPSISSAMALIDTEAFPFRSESVVAKKSDRLECRPLKSGQELARDSTAFSMSASFPARFSKRARNETVPRAMRSAWDDPTRPRYRIPRRQRRQPRRARGQWPRRVPLPACKHRDILAETTR